MYTQVTIIVIVPCTLALLPGLLMLNEAIIYAQVDEPVSWKTFKDAKGLFTIKYPSNWEQLPSSNSSNPIETEFRYEKSTCSGDDCSFAYLTVVKFEGKSTFTHARDRLESASAYSKVTNTNYKIERPIECSRYTINDIAACSVIESFSVPDEGYRMVMNLAAIDSGGTEYGIFYVASSNLFRHFFPVAQSMIKSFVLAEDAAVTTPPTPPSTLPNKSGSTTPMPHSSTYENSVYGMKMDYPSDWLVTSGGNGSGVNGIVTLFSPENFDYVTVGLFIEDLSVSGSGQNLNQYLASSISLYSNTPDDYPGFILNFSKIAGSLAGSPAYLLEGRYNDPTLGIQNLMDTGTIRGNLAYYITYFGSPSKYVEYLPTVKAMIDSIEITKSTPTQPPAQPTPAPPSAPLVLSNKFGLDKTKDIRFEDGTGYPIKYKISGGQISSMDLERSTGGAPSFVIKVNTRPQDSDDGKIVVEIPNTVLNSNGNFYAYDNVSPTEWKKLATDSNSTILEVEFANYQPELRTIEILGER